MSEWNVNMMTAFLNGEPVFRGTFEQCETWMKLTPLKKGDKVSLRSDWDLSQAPPGMFD